MKAERNLAHPEYAPLVDAGVHGQVAAVLCGIVAHGSGFSVTWALVLARLLTMEGPARRRLAQTFGDYDDECVLQPFPHLLIIFDLVRMQRSESFSILHADP